MKKFLHWPVLLVLAALLVVTLVPTILTASNARKAHASSGATISLSSPTGQPGTTVQVTGTNFAPGQAASIYFGSPGGALLATATTDASGNLPSTNIIVPDQPAAAYTIVAVQGTVNASTTLGIVPIISLSRKLLFPGVVFTVNGKGFGSNEVVDVFIDSAGGYPITYFGCNANGDCSHTVKVPSYNLLQGLHTLIVTGDAGLISARTPITLLPHVSPLTGQSGTSAQISGSAFTANETVSVYWGTAQGQLEGSTTTDAYGNLRFTFTVPSGLPNGSYPVTVARSNQKPSLVSTTFHIVPLTMTAMPGGIQIGQGVVVKVTGFLSKEYVTVSWNANGGQTLTTIYADQFGTASGSFSPPSALPGSYTLTAVGTTSGIQATSSLNIGPGISKGYGDPGSTMTFYGGGFSANETINVYFQAQKNGVVTTTTDTTGAFSVSLTIPSTYDPSTHYYVYAVSTTSNEHASAPFKFFTPIFSACDSSCNDVFYGQPITFSDSHFAVGETVNVIWNYQQPGQFTIATIPYNPFNISSVSEVVPSTPNQSNVTIAAIGQTSHLIVTTTVLNDAAIYDNPAHGTPGTVISVNGGSFHTGDTITLSLQGKTVASTTSASDGTFSTTFHVPSISGAGDLTLTATDSITNTSATVPFQYMPAITVSPNVVQSGDVVKVTGLHFSANSSATVYFGGTSIFNTYNEYTDANGAFTATFSVAGFSSGTYYVTAQDWKSELGVTAAFVVQ